MRPCGSRTFAVMTIVVLLSTPATAAQRAQRKPSPPPVAEQFHVTEATRTIALQRLDSRIAATASLGKYGDPLVCPEVEVYAYNAFGGLRSQDFVANFDTEARAAGYRIAGSSTDLFGGSDSTAPQVLVGAIIQDLKVGGCSGSLFANGASVNATMTVEWQVFDPLEKKVLLKTTVTATGKAKGELKLVTPQVTRAAFQETAKKLLAMPDFVAAVRDPNGPAPSPQNSLFPEATNAAAKPDLPKRIPHVALSKTPFSEQVEALRKQVVTIRTPNGTGTGYYIADGLLLTNEHVIRGSTTFKVKFLDGHESEGVVLTKDAKRDVALLMAEPTGLPGLPLRTDPPGVSSRVYVIGSPLREKNEGSVTTGIISAFRTEKMGPLIQSDAPVTNGNSGGPMFDEFGNVIGMTDFGELNRGQATAVNMFIPVADALKVLGLEIEPAATAEAAKQ